MNKKFLRVELDFDFILISITSQLKDYRLCYQINKILTLNFIKIDDLEIVYSGLSPRYHSRYLHLNNEFSPQFYLISNRGTEGYLIPELKETDYLILIKDFIDEEDLDFFMSGLKKINDIQVAIDLDPKKLKSRENLIF